jgi:MFS family permease
MKPISPRNDLLFQITQFLYATIFTIPIWIVYYQTKITLVEVSFLVAIQYASQLFLELPTGAFADLLGRKASIAIGYFLWMLASLLIIIAPGFWLIALATILGGLAESFLSGSLEAIIYDSHKLDKTEDQFPKVMSTNNILFQFGLILGTITGGFLYNISHELPYILYAVLCLISTILTFWMIEPAIDSEKFTFANYIKQIKEGTHHAFHNRRTTLVSLYYISVAGITWTVNLYFFDLALTQLFTSDQLRGIVGASIRLVNILILAGLVRNEKIFTRKISIWFFPVVMSIGYFGTWFFFTQPYIPLIFLALAVMCGTARWVILTKYTNECFDSKYRATAISALSMLVGVFYIAITSSSGFLVEYFHGMSAIFLILGILTALFIIPLARLNAKIV